ncbi:hypothetical protein C8Q76DRAFT_700443 [Earliella scabrosa]|nr:hypothetical protein C8Q76DRAFT_700443 [Earliella scabrosa]
MTWLYAYRNISLVTATIGAIVVLAFGARTLAGLESLLDPSADYGKLGVAASALALVSIPLIFYLGHGRLSILLEVLWLAFLWFLFITVAGLAFRAHIDVSRLLDDFAFSKCNGLDFAGQRSVCKNALPLGICALVTGLVLVLYTVVLSILTWLRTKKERRIWKISVKESEQI